MPLQQLTRSIPITPAMLMMLTVFAALSARAATAGIEGQPEMLELVANVSRANVQSLDTWVGEASYSQVTEREGRQPTTELSAVFFVFDREQDVVRNRIKKLGPHRYIMPDGKAHASDAEIVVNQMRKGNAFFWVNRLENKQKGPERQILHVGGRPTGFQALTFFDPRSYFFDTSRPPVWDTMDLYLRNRDKTAMPARVHRVGNKVTLEVGPAQSVNRYVFDLEQAGNLVEYFAGSDDGGKNEVTQRIRIEYETLKKVVVPKKWSEELQSRTTAGTSITKKREMKFDKNAVNDPLDPREISIEALGIKVGDVIKDGRTNRTYEYNGKPLPTTVPAGAFEGSPGVEPLPAELRADASGRSDDAATAAGPLNMFWPCVIGICIVAGSTASAWRRGGAAAAAGPEGRPTVRCLLAAWVPRVVGVLLVIAAVSKAANPSDLKQVLAFDGFHARLIPMITFAVVIGELLVGMGLLLNWGGSRMIVVAIAVFGIYSAQLGYLLVSKKAPDCACLGLILDYRSAREGHVFGLARNLVTMAALFWVLLTTRLPAGRTLSTDAGRLRPA